MRPSDCTVSDNLETLHDLNVEIEDCLLLGEKVSMIADAGHLYNHLRGQITPAYLSAEEFEWLKGVALSWNECTREYNRQMQGTMTQEQQENINDLQDDIRRALDELMDGEQYDMG